MLRYVYEWLFGPFPSEPFDVFPDDGPYGYAEGKNYWDD